MVPAQVGDIDTEMLMWYRPEDQPDDTPRPAFSVDLANGASDLGGSVTAALAAASVLFQAQNDSAYADQLLAKAKEVSACPRTRNTHPTLLPSPLASAAPHPNPAHCPLHHHRTGVRLLHRGQGQVQRR